MATIVQSNTYQLPSSRQFKVFGKGSVDTEVPYQRSLGSLDSDEVPPSPSRRTRGSSNIQYGAPGVNCRRSLSIEHAMGGLIGYDNEGCEVDLFDEPEEMERGGFFFEEEDEEDDYATPTQNGLFSFKEDATLVQVAPAPVLASYLAEQAEETASAPIIVELPDSPIIPEVEVVSAPAPASAPAVASEPAPVPIQKAAPAGVRSPPTRSAALQALRDAPPPPPPRNPPPLPPRTPSPVPRILISPPDEHPVPQREDSFSSVSSTSSEVVEVTKVVGRTTASVVSVAALAQVIVGPHMVGGKAGEKTPLLSRGRAGSIPSPTPEPGSRTTLIASVAVVLVLTPALLLAAHFIFK